MRKMYIVTVTTTLIVVGALALSDSDYQSWMKSNGANMGSMNKKIAAKDGAGAAADAEKLEATFKQVEDFWKKRGGAADIWRTAKEPRLVQDQVKAQLPATK